MQLAIVGGVADLDQRVVTVHGVPRSLSAQEAELLRRLAQADGAPVTRRALLVEVMGYRDARATRALDNAIRRLRTKLEVDPDAPAHLLTVRGVGYRFAPCGRLVGRSAALDALEDALAGPLVTLHGPGGIGKSALAREVLARRGGVWVALEPVAPEGLAAAVARALGAAGDDPIDAVARALRAPAPPGAIVVLDGLDALVDAARALLDAWLGARPLLVTSRVRLGHAAERVVPVHPLDGADARRLYLERARGGATAEGLDELLGCLDGHPLAIELAAAWADLIGPAALAGRLRSSVGPLGGRDGGGLGAVLDASWAQLGSAERRALSEAALFAGGFDADAAEAVWAVDTATALRTLATLRDRALLAAEVEPPRFRLLEPVRVWAEGHLDAASEAAIRHARHYLGWARVHGDEARVVERERENLSAAIRRTAGTRLGAELVVARYPADWANQPAAATLQAFEDAAGWVGSEAADVSARLAAGRGALLTRAGNLTEALAQYAVAEEHADRAGDAVLRSKVARTHGQAHVWAGNLAEARACFERALAAAEESGVAAVRVQALGAVARLAEMDERAADAEPMLAAAASLALRLAPNVRADLLRRLGDAALARGEPDEAEARLDEADAHDDPGAFGVALSQLQRCVAALIRGDGDRIRQLAGDLRARPPGDPLFAPLARAWVGFADWLDGRPSPAPFLAASLVARDAGRVELAGALGAAAAAARAEVDGRLRPIDGLGPKEAALWGAFGRIPAARSGDPEARAAIHGALAHAGSSVGARIAATLLARHGTAVLGDDANDATHLRR